MGFDSGPGAMISDSLPWLTGEKTAERKLRAVGILPCLFLGKLGSKDTWIFIKIFNFFQDMKFLPMGKSITNYNQSVHPELISKLRDIKMNEFQIKIFKYKEITHKQTIFYLIFFL